MALGEDILELSESDVNEMTDEEISSLYYSPNRNNFFEIYLGEAGDRPMTLAEIKKMAALYWVSNEKLENKVRALTEDYNDVANDLNRAKTKTVDALEEIISDLKTSIQYHKEQVETEHPQKLAEKDEWWIRDVRD